MHDAPKDAAKHPEIDLARTSGLGRITKPGTVLKDKWRLDKLLGVGGMAVVYAATHRNGKRVAIKMLHQEHSRNVDVTKRFLREGYLANAVDHDGAVSVLDDDVTDEGVVFLVMELLEGETVERRWERKERRLPVGETLSIAHELLDVLAAAHAKGVVHRDIKPENIFLTRTGKLKVLDFGIARLRHLSGTGSTTQSGATMGTPAFMSPEQARGRWDEVDARSDLWAVGATMFALLSGRFVHRAGTLNEQLLAAMTTHAVPITSLIADLTPEVAQVIDRALTYAPDDRWQDARAMQSAIRVAYAATRVATNEVAVRKSDATPASAQGAGFNPPRTSAVDPDETEAMAPLDFDAPATPTIEQGVANAPSAAPESRVAPVRRSPIYVGITAGALGIALTLAAFVRHSVPAPLAALIHPRLAAPVAAAVVRVDPFPVVLAHDAGAVVEEAARMTPSPPATGVPLSVSEVEESPAPAPHPPPPASLVEANPAPAPAASVASVPPSAAPAPAPAPESQDPAKTEGLLDRRH